MLRATKLTRQASQLSRELLSDARKDFSSRRVPNCPRLVWCAALPKSGSTRIEALFNLLPYVDATTSLLRLRKIPGPHHEHSLSTDFIRSYSRGPRLTFVKTHSHLEVSTVDVAWKCGTQLFVSLRDLRDMMISRYFHVMAESTHWQHDLIKDMPVEKGFISSLRLTRPQNPWNVPIDYYYGWIRDWRLFSQANSNVPLLWYEDFSANEELQVRRILELVSLSLNQDAHRLVERLSASREKQRRLSLDTNLKRFSRKKSTFREGRSRSWETFMSESLLSAFEESLPGPSSIAYYD